MSKRLKIRNWGLITSEVDDLAKALDRRGILPLEQSYYQLIIRGLTPNPHFSQFGFAALVSLGIERLFFPWIESNALPNASEVRALFKLFPEMSEFFLFRQDGKKWWLTFRSRSKEWNKSDWARRRWRLIFDRGRDYATFEVAGPELQNLLESFSTTITDRRFGAFAEKNGLLSRGPERGILSEAGEPEIKLVSHSCLLATDGRSRVALDPVFFLSRPENRVVSRFEPMERALADLQSVDAVFFSHNHWDHFHVSTIARIPRSTPVYVPRVARETAYNPSLARFLRSLGFERVTELRPWDEARVGAIQVTSVPFYGEWFGPGSAFDGSTYELALGGKRVFAAVDSFRDERGEMTPTLRELTKKRGRPDYFFCGAVGGSHVSTLVCGMPFAYSNSNARHAPKLRYLPDSTDVSRWLKVARPRFVVPYADFAFHRSQATEASAFKMALKGSGARLVRLKPGDSIKL